MLSSRSPVYPRWRGEHSVVTTYHNLRRGLSPLARGTLISKPITFQLVRFIPAGAGNTPTSADEKPVVTVYPRWRGEHSPAELNKINADGLSPLARGTPPGGLHQRGLQRFIPAGAGNTCRFLGDITLMAVYPRWRGEHTKRISLFINYFLSAPHSTNIIATI